MSGDLEQKLKALISAQHRLSALANLYEMQPKCASDAVLSEAKARLQRLRHILRGIDTLLLLVPEEERYILELHLVSGMKWETVMTEYQKRWSYDTGADKRTYMNRQQSAIRKMCRFVEHFSYCLDFSWLDDPLIDEINSM